MVRTRDAFIRVDPRLEGSIPRYQLAATLKAGGMELTPQQQEDAKHKYVTGDGKFNWKTFCNDIEKARMHSWSQAMRVKHAKLFSSVDTDSSGKIGKEELAVAVRRMNIKVSDHELTNLFSSMDEDRDGNLDLPEFIDGLATNLVMPSHVFDTVARNHTGPYKLGGVKYSKQGQSPRMSPR